MTMFPLLQSFGISVSWFSHRTENLRQVDSLLCGLAVDFLFSFCSQRYFGICAQSLAGNQNGTLVLLKIPVFLVISCIVVLLSQKFLVLCTIFRESGSIPIASYNLSLYIGQLCHFSFTKEDLLGQAWFVDMVLLCYHFSRQVFYKMIRDRLFPFLQVAPRIILRYQTIRQE